MTQPWTPPTPPTWNAVTQLLRSATDHDLTIPEEDQNKNDVDNAINYLGQLVLNYIQGATGFETGDVKWTFRSSVSAGWLLCDHRTMGSESSGANLLGATYQPLFNFIWAFATNSDLLTSAGGATTKGVDADADWNANKRLFLPDCRGRVLVSSGQGPSLTNRLLGEKFGAEYYTDARTYYIDEISVTGDTPEISYSQTINIPSLSGTIDPTAPLSVSGGTVTFPTFDPGSYTPGTLPTWTAGSAATWSAGTLASYSPGTLPSLTIDTTGNITSQNKTGLGLTGYAACVAKGTEVGMDAMGCATLTVVDFTVDISKADIGGLFTFNEGSLPVYVDGTLPSWTPGTAATWDPGALPSYTAPSSTGGDNAVSGATVDVSGVGITTLSQDYTQSLTIPATPLSGVTASGYTDANSIDIPTVPPSIVANLWIKL